MVKMIVSIAVSLVLLAGAAVFETLFIDAQFAQVREALEVLEEKVREENALPADTQAVQKLWENKKEKLHAVIPHNDISYIDYWLGEADGCIEAGLYADALSKIEVLLVICKQIPQTYALTFENVF